MTNSVSSILCVFFFNDTATTEIYTLSLHDALPISIALSDGTEARGRAVIVATGASYRRLGVPSIEGLVGAGVFRSEEHTSELQSRQYLVCRLLLEKKKNHLINFQSNMSATCFSSPS